MEGSPALLRRYTFKLYPSRAQSAALDCQRRMHAALYNGLLHQRIEAYRRAVEHTTGKGKTLSYYDQCKELTALRNDPEIGAEWTALSSDAMAATAQRVDRAMKAFFRRAKAGMGAQSGFPRFKRSDDYPGFSYKRHGSGWNLQWRDAGPKPANGSIYFKGVPGRVKFRGRLPARPEEIKTCELLWRGGDWWLSLVVAMTPRRKAGRGHVEIKFDLIDEFAVERTANGGCPAGPEHVENSADEGRIISRFQGDCATSAPVAPETGSDDRRTSSQSVSALAPVAPETGSDDRCLRMRVRPPTAPVAPETGSDDRKMRHSPPRETSDLQRAMARCKRGSHRYRKLRHLKARAEARAARQRREAAHRLTTQWQREYQDVTVVAPASIAEATSSGRGDERRWGAAVKTKAMLNRHVLDQAPSAVIQMLQYKIAEAGGSLIRRDDEAAPVLAGTALVSARKQVRNVTGAIKKEELHHGR